MTTANERGGGVLTMAYPRCSDCRRGIVTPAQVERWPHLARYTIGVLDERGRCEPCAFTRARKAAQVRAHTLNKRHGRCVAVDLLNRIVEVDDLLADWEVLRDADVPVAAAAERLHLAENHLRQVLAQARQRGDERGYLQPYARDAPRPARLTLRTRRLLSPTE